MRAKEFLRESDQLVDATFIQSLVKGIHRRLHDFEEGDLVDRIYWFRQYKLVELPISNIDLAEWDLDDALVTDHVAEIMRSKHTMPPIVFDPISKSIIDGTHRANAYHQLGMKTIPAYVGTVKSSDYGQTSDYENESISESAGELFRGVIPQIKYLNARMIIAKDLSTQLQSVRWWLQDNPGKTKEDWAKYWIRNAKPIPVTWQGETWDMHIHDGHHRFLAYKILELMPRVIVTATQVPVQYIRSLISEDDGSLQTGGPDED